WVYPPPLDASKEEKGAGIGALSVIDKNPAAKSGNPAQYESNAPKSTISGKDVRKAIKDINASSANPTTSTSGQTDVEMTAPNGVEDDDENFVPQTSKTDPNAAHASTLPTYQSIAAAAGMSSSSTGVTKLFEGLSFWLSRETPRGLLEFVIRSCGGKVGWDATVGGGSPYDESSEVITHVVIDRPAVAPPPPASQQNDTGSSVTVEEDGDAALKRQKRKYIQPQWVVDCINAGRILSEDKYERGKLLPPHLSPFGEEQGAYQPDAEDGGVDGHGDTIMKGAQQEDESESESEEEEEEVIEGEELPDEEDEESDAEQEEAVENVQKRKAKKEKALLKRAQVSGRGRHQDAEALRAAELEAEAAGVDFTEFEKAMKHGTKKMEKDTTIKGATSQQQQQEAVRATEKEMNKMMMSNKQRKLYEKMKYTERKKAEEKAKLEQRKAAIQKAKRKETKVASSRTRHFTGSNGVKYKWKIQWGQLQLYNAASEGTKQQPLAVFHRHRSPGNSSYLEILDLSVLNSLDSIIVTFLIMERHRRDRAKAARAHGGGGGPGGGGDGGGGGGG
ncbi:mRNA-binding ribosome synthesis protein nop7, partial [Serendipita sp. 399]